MEGFKQNFYKARVSLLTLVSITTHLQNNFRNQTLSLTSSLVFLFHEDLNMLQNCFSCVSASMCPNLHMININICKELFNANKNLNLDNGVSCIYKNTRHQLEHH